jgi:hypothetical protein
MSFKIQWPGFTFSGDLGLFSGGENSKTIRENTRTKKPHAVFTQHEAFVFRTFDSL